MGITDEVVDAVADAAWASAALAVAHGPGTGHRRRRRSSPTSLGGRTRSAATSPSWCSSVRSRRVPAGRRRRPASGTRSTRCGRWPPPRRASGVATVITHAKPHELERGLGSWHAEWFAIPLVFQTAAQQWRPSAPRSPRSKSSHRHWSSPTIAAPPPTPTSPQSWSNHHDIVLQPHRTGPASPTRSAAGRGGRALILTHSLGSDHHMWDPQVEALKDQYYIVSIDNIGHGDSDVPAGDYSVADMADGVLAVADAAELERFHYCGLSVGGITGQWLGVHHPDRLLSLTLCNTAAKIGTPELWDERIEIARRRAWARWSTA